MTVPRRMILGLALGAALIAAGCESSPSPSPSSAPSDASGAPSAAPTPSAYAGLWTDATADLIGETGEWTNKVEAADLNADGYPDLLFANGGDYETPGTPVATRVFLNSGEEGGAFREVTSEVMGDLVALTRVAKVADLDADGNPDIVLGTTFQTQSQLLLGTGGGAFTNATAQLPQVPLSVGDVDIGDVDADGDLDLVLADWGPGSPMESLGAPVRLWLNDGSARFTDFTDAQMPATAARFSWELELVDIDNDWDLDLAVSAKVSAGSFLFENDGSGRFSDVSEGRMPRFTNNYDFEAMDLDLDGYLDLVTINDGEPMLAGGREHAFRNDGAGGFEDVSDEWWPDAENPGEDDNSNAFLDVDSDGDADVLVGSLTSPDRLMINDGSGHLTMELAAFDAPLSGGTLGMIVVDLDNDDRWDVVEAQGENPSAEDERIYLATERVPVDATGPVVRAQVVPGADGQPTVRARVHDFKAHRDGELQVLLSGSDGQLVLLSWYGEFLYRADVPNGVDPTNLEVCASDLAGNQTCVALLT